MHLGKDRTIKLLSVECESESGDSDVYLSSLKEEVCSVGYGAFGSSGSLGYENKKITVNGKLSRYIYIPIIFSTGWYHVTSNFRIFIYVWFKKRYGLSLHPPSNGYSYVSYSIQEGGYNLFTASVAINDDVIDGCMSDIYFELLGDGVSLWKSPTMKSSQVVIPGNQSVHQLVNVSSLSSYFLPLFTSSWMNAANSLPPPFSLLLPSRDFESLSFCIY